MQKFFRKHPKRRGDKNIYHFCVKYWLTEGKRPVKILYSYQVEYSEDEYRVSV